mmetsp:Transcript_34066/g.81187  ORF Transcript_34066/g.81187 Transcript_34066/m.81187 type:complete len:380 (-) Transcript_34066:94-1233(-)
MRQRLLQGKQRLRSLRAVSAGLRGDGSGGGLRAVRRRHLCVGAGRALRGVSGGRQRLGGQREPQRLHVQRREDGLRVPPAPRAAEGGPDRAARAAASDDAAVVDGGGGGRDRAAARADAGLLPRDAPRLRSVRRRRRRAAPAAADAGGGCREPRRALEPRGPDRLPAHYRLRPQLLPLHGGAPLSHCPRRRVLLWQRPRACGPQLRAVPARGVQEPCRQQLMRLVPRRRRHSGPRQPRSGSVQVPGRLCGARWRALQGVQGWLLQGRQRLRGVRAVRGWELLERDGCHELRGVRCGAGVGAGEHKRGGLRVRRRVHEEQTLGVQRQGCGRLRAVQAGDVQGGARDAGVQRVLEQHVHGRARRHRLQGVRVRLDAPGGAH